LLAMINQLFSERLICQYAFPQIGIHRIMWGIVSIDEIAFRYFRIGGHNVK
jgi:hypothetical protein